MNDNANGPIYFVVGRVRRERGDVPAGFHALLAAPDDETAIRRTLQSLAAEGYASAELDRIGEMTARPDDEPHASAWDSAAAGEIAIVTFDDLFGDEWDDGNA